MWIVWPQLVLTLQPVAAAHSAPASELKLVPRQSCTVLPAAVIETSAAPTVVPDACAAASGEAGWPASRTGRGRGAGGSGGRHAGAARARRAHRLRDGGLAVDRDVMPG